MVDREKIKGIWKSFGRNKYVLAVPLLGLVLLLLPTGGKDDEAEPASVDIRDIVFSVDDEEKRLEDILSRISGAGKVRVCLSLVGGIEKELAENETGVLVISGSDGDETVELRCLYPEYQGAVVVCGGADNASVRLAITEAVSNYTGLKSNRISVIKMSN